jgi:thiamine pyrophosphate-dependent acetolactate synthase large subunit-like protein
LTPLEAVAAVVAAAPKALFVSSLGTATSALRAASDEAPHLYLGGAMGCALGAAIGVAEARPGRQVVVILGDGEALMGAGSLWSLAGVRPSNLLVVILVDGHYSITGGQSIAVPEAFAGVAHALGLTADVARDASTVTDFVVSLPRPAVLEVRCEASVWPGPSPFVDPPIVRWRFEAAATADVGAA